MCLWRPVKYFGRKGFSCKQSHKMYKNIEKNAVIFKKNKNFLEAGRLFMVAAGMRVRHADNYYNGVMDDGHFEFYNNTLRAAKKAFKRVGIII